MLVEDRLAQYERKRRGTATEPVVAKKAPQPKVDVGARKEQRELAKEMAAVKISARRVPSKVAAMLLRRDPSSGRCEPVARAFMEARGGLSLSISISAH